MTHGCGDCKYCRCYRGDYWTPDEYECSCPNEIDDDSFIRAWEDGEEWSDCEEPVCPEWKEAPTEYDEYWDRYNYEESHNER